MKKLRLLFVLVILAISLCLSGCDIVMSYLSGDDTDINDSNLEDGGAEDKGEDDGEENDNNSGDVSDNPDHVCDFVHTSYVESTCSVAGKNIYKCSCGKEQYEPRPLLAHTEEIIPATKATESSPEKTEGKKCSVCGYIIVAPKVVFSSEYTTPEKYDGNYAYNYLASLKNGENLTKLYNSIDLRADLFHISGENAKDDLIISDVNFSELGLTQDEALAVWSAYITDHPLYYWMSKNVSYTKNSISLKVDEEYKNGDVRNAYNAKIYDKAKHFITSINVDSEYIISMMLHDFIISSGDYAYEADGVTPKDDTYAHNILGILEIGEGVCESYAKSFQMMLNYCGVENVFVSGDAGEPHAWNLVKLDDGKWYWFDLTWDDTPGFMWGTSYRYFAVSDNETLLDIDGPWYDTEPKTFAQSHKPLAKCDTGVGFMYELPESSKTEFGDSEFLLRSTFKVGDFTYAIAGYDKVQLIKIERAGDVAVPETVEYNGALFEIAAIGRMDADGTFNSGSLVREYYNEYGELALQITSISIPASVDIIWDDALNIHSLASITVDSDNEYYASLDGVLFTKDLKTLVKYPSAKTGASYALPDETVKIAAFAFNMYFSNMEMKYLETVTLGESTSDAGITHYGYGYANSDKGNYSDGEWAKIELYLKGEGNILTKSGEKFSKETK